jgi:hypothetical protein
MFNVMSYTVTKRNYLNTSYFCMVLTGPRDSNNSTMEKAVLLIYAKTYKYENNRTVKNYQIKS